MVNNSLTHIFRIVATFEFSLEPRHLRLKCCKNTYFWHFSHSIVALQGCSANSTFSFAFRISFCLSFCFSAFLRCPVFFFGIFTGWLHLLKIKSNNYRYSSSPIGQISKFCEVIFRNESCQILVMGSLCKLNRYFCFGMLRKLESKTHFIGFLKNYLLFTKIHNYNISNENNNDYRL